MTTPIFDWHLKQRMFLRLYIDYSEPLAHSHLDALVGILLHTDYQVCALIALKMKMLCVLETCSLSHIRCSNHPIITILFTNDATSLFYLPLSGLPLLIVGLTLKEFSLILSLYYHPLVSVRQCEWVRARDITQLNINALNLLLRVLNQIAGHRRLVRSVDKPS